MKSRSILAGFQTENEAKKAYHELQQSGLSEIQLEHVSAYPGEEELNEPMNPSTGNISSLADLTLNADIASHSERILVAAEPSASGLSGDREPDFRPFLLTVVADEAKAEKAESIIRSHNGEI